MVKLLLFLLAQLAFVNVSLGQTPSRGLTSPTSSEDPLATEVGKVRGQLIARADAEYAKNGEGTIVRLKDGTLFHAFSRHMRGKETNPDLWPAVVAQMTSSDDGRTWSKAQTLFRSTTGQNAMQPSIARLASGELGITYSRINSISSATKVFRYSRDEGHTWSDEILMSPMGSYWTSAHDRMVVLSTGRIVHPLHTKLEVRPEKMATRVAYSDDNGRTWKLAPQTLIVEDVIPEFAAKYKERYAYGFWEASIAERADGTLLMIGRTYGGYLYATTSNDKGATWSKLQPTTLMSSAAPGKIERIPGTKDLLVVWNSCCLDPQDFLLGKRLTLSSAISKDDGATWRYQREIEAIAPVEGTSRIEYPSIYISGDKAFITYRAGSRALPPQALQEYLSVLPLEWFDAAAKYHRPEAAATVGSK